MAHQFKKRFGQNFLRDQNLLKKIVQTAKINNKHVIEIGPGEGGLTKHAIKEALSLVAYEIDTTLQPTLSLIEQSAQNVTFIYEDFLSLTTFDTKYAHIIGNIPYNITSPILFKVLALDHIERATFMVQKEFAERMTASPKTKAYNALSVMMQLSFHTTYEFTVTKKVFYPVPKVDSAIVSLQRKNVSNKELNQFVKDCFKQKRKTIINNLYETRNIPKEMIADALLNLGYIGNARAEEVKPEDFVNLFNKTLT
jgi:16S rRNA (adenine1518-N6/adenine1519-N6)-dimethyltransferase